MSKSCPRCHTELDESVRFCFNCGWEFRKKKTRRWKEMQFQNVSFSEVKEWFNDHNGEIEIVNCRGNIKYNTSGFFIKTRDWFFQYLTIRYYDDEKASKSYDLVYDAKYDHLLSSGARNAESAVQSQLNGRKTVFNITRSSHFSGGENREYSCCLAIYEKA